MQTTLTTTIDAPAEVIFSYLTNADKLTRWQTFLSSAQQTTPGNVTTGTQFRLTINVEQQFPQAVSILNTTEMVLQGEVITYDPPTQLVIQSNSSQADVGIAYTCEEQDGITTLTQKTTLEFNNLLINAVAPLVKGMLEKRSKNDLRQLKKLVESNR